MEGMSEKKEGPIEGVTHERRDRDSRDRGNRDGDRRDRDGRRDSRDRERRDRDGRRDSRDRERRDRHGRRHSSRSRSREGRPGMNRGDSRERKSLATMNKKERRAELSKEDSSKIIWGKSSEYINDEAKTEENTAPIVKEKANFGLSGALAKDEATGNVVNGIVLKHSEPLDRVIPKQLWRLYVFKDNDIIETLHIHRQSSYLFGRDDRVCDIILSHPSISKQHAVVQFRIVDVQDKKSEEVYQVIKPYLIDLGSANKTILNSKPIDDARYYELKEKDSIKFGSSSRDYILMRADL